jgi:hypothetical protein
VIVRANVHDCLVLPTQAATGKHSDWEEVLSLHKGFAPEIERIRHLVGHSLMSMMVLFDFLSRRIAPLQLCACPAWLERGHRSDLATDVLATLLERLSPDPSSTDFITPLAACAPMCSDQAMRTRLLKELPMLEDIGITARQRGDESWGMQIPVTDIASGQSGVNTSLGSGKGKGKVASFGSTLKVSSWTVLSDTKVSADDDCPLQRRKRFYCSDRSTVGRPPLLGQQAPDPATASQTDPKAVASMTMCPGGSGGGGSITSVKEATDCWWSLSPTE